MKLESEAVTNDNNKNKTQVGQKYQLQRQYSCKDVPEKLPKNNDNGIKHSTSEVNLNQGSNLKINRPTSRKNSFSKPSRNQPVPNVSRIPNPVSSKGTENRDYVPMKNDPKDEVHTPVTHFGKLPDEPKVSLVRTPLDRPVGLDLEEFLPVSQILF